jgi:hypothetical protein
MTREQKHSVWSFIENKLFRSVNVHELVHANFPEAKNRCRALRKFWVYFGALLSLLSRCSYVADVLICLSLSHSLSLAHSFSL